MERRGRAVVLGRSERDRPAFLVFRTVELFELVVTCASSSLFARTARLPPFSSFPRLCSRTIVCARANHRRSLACRAPSPLVHIGARRGGAGTLSERMASLRAVAPATLASSRRAGDASAPKTRGVATVAPRGAASGRAESALFRKVRTRRRAAQPPALFPRGEARPSTRPPTPRAHHSPRVPRARHRGPRRARPRGSTFEIRPVPIRTEPFFQNVSRNRFFHRDYQTASSDTPHLREQRRGRPEPHGLFFSLYATRTAASLGPRP